MCFASAYLGTSGLTGESYVMNVASAEFFLKERKSVCAFAYKNSY